MNSLFIVGQPRGLTSHVYRVAVEALGLKSSAPVGEVLNVRDTNPHKIPMFTSADNEYMFEMAKYVLSFYQSDFAVKDVVNPFLSLRYLTEVDHNFKVLHVHRDPRVCRFLQEKRGWDHIKDFNLPITFVREYVEKFQTYFKTVYFKELVTDPEHLWDALEGIGFQVSRFNYLTNEFVQKREEMASLLGGYR